MARQESYRLRHGGKLFRFKKAKDYGAFLIKALIGKTTAIIGEHAIVEREYDVPECSEWTEEQIAKRLEVHLYGQSEE